MNYTTKFGKTIISFSIQYRKRKTLAIHVYPDKTIEVIAPLDVSIEKIKNKVLKRSPWIIRKQIEFNRLQPSLPEPHFIAGETYRFLGKQYRLKNIQVNFESIQIKDSFITIYSKYILKPDQVKKRILNWYKDRAKIILEKRLLVCIKNVKKIGINKKPEWSLRVMQKRWGSCTKKRKILFHPELVAAPKDCIDYVITHELCHLLEYNHSSKYYDLLKKVMPDWEKRKNQLNETIEVRLM